MPDLDRRVADGLREIARRAPVDADVWQATERHVARHRRQRHTIRAAVVAVVLIASGLATAAAVRSGDSKVRAANPGRTPLTASGPIDGAFTITALPNITFTPSVLRVHTGIYAVTFIDAAAASHVLDFDNASTLWSPQTVNSRGETKTSRIYFGQPGDYIFFCAVPGHREAGEQGVVHVTGSPMTLAQAEAVAKRQ